MYADNMGYIQYEVSSHTWLSWVTSCGELFLRTTSWQGLVYKLGATQQNSVKIKKSSKLFYVISQALHKLSQSVTEKQLAITR